MHIFQDSNLLYSRCETNVSGLPHYRLTTVTSRASMQLQCDCGWMSQCLTFEGTFRQTQHAAASQCSCWTTVQLRWFNHDKPVYAHEWRTVSRFSNGENERRFVTENTEVLNVTFVEQSCLVAVILLREELCA